MCPAVPLLCLRSSEICQQSCSYQNLGRMDIILVNAQTTAPSAKSHALRAHDHTDGDGAGRTDMHGLLIVSRDGNSLVGDELAR